MEDSSSRVLEGQILLEAADERVVNEESPISVKTNVRDNAVCSKVIGETVAKQQQQQQLPSTLPQPSSRLLINENLFVADHAKVFHGRRFSGYEVRFKRVRKQRDAENIGRSIVVVVLVIVIVYYGTYINVTHNSVVSDVTQRRK
ncbi:hypothetical protein M0804_004472 [Polistes exclamans]|nr:hypothetical protein M0804_004472 [Polistes exclamans]